MECEKKKEQCQLRQFVSQLLPATYLGGTTWVRSFPRVGIMILVDIEFVWVYCVDDTNPKNKSANTLNELEIHPEPYNCLTQ